MPHYYPFHPPLYDFHKKVEGDTFDFKNEPVDPNGDWDGDGDFDSADLFAATPACKNTIIPDDLGEFIEQGPNDQAGFPAAVIQWDIE